ncbi:hypothetical protein C8Q76DRAFT_568358, partial [Earliella scabrosa]
LELSGAMIGGIGATVVLFPHLAPALPPPCPVDVYVPRGGIDTLKHYLTSTQGFNALEMPPSLFPSTGAAGHHPRGVHSVVRLQKGSFHLDLYESTTAAALYPLTSAWNSALFNYITPRMFCSAYPLLTAAQQALLNPLCL